MPKYVLRDGLVSTTVPGVGVVGQGVVIEGDLDRFVPGKLMLMPYTGPVVAPEPAPSPVSVPKPAPPPPPPEEDEPEPEEEEGERPTMEWRKADLIDAAEEYGLDASGTKQDIVDRIDEYLDGD